MANNRESKTGGGDRERGEVTGVIIDRIWREEGRHNNNQDCFFPGQ